MLLSISVINRVETYIKGACTLLTWSGGPRLVRSTSTSTLWAEGPQCFDQPTFAAGLRAAGRRSRFVDIRGVHFHLVYVFCS